MHTFRSAVVLSALWATMPGMHRLQAGEVSTLYRLDDGRTRRASSADEPWMNPNSDSRALPEGETLTLADLEGPGIIRHMWFTFYGSDPKQGRSLVLRIYWDDQSAPAVEVPVGDFFAVGHGGWRRVNSQMVSISSEARSYNCYWPMPFNQRARITLTNDSKQYRAGVFYYIDYDEKPGLEPDTPLFHARYRQEYPVEPGSDYVVLETRGRGHYVGTVLSVQFRTTGWFGEGDDKFYIDGESEPSLRGTGTEDYFCDAWGFREFNRPYYGVSLWEGIDVGDRVSAYRWHVPDPIRFRESLKVTFEHMGVMENQRGEWFSNFQERHDLYSSVAFWYQLGQAPEFPPLPPVELRTPPHVHIELDTLADRIQAQPKRMPRTEQRGNYSGGRHLLFMPVNAAASVTVPFTLERPIKGVARLRLAREHAGGAWQVQLDGRKPPRMHTVDLYSPHETDFVELILGRVDLGAGEHELLFECTGKNPGSQGYHLSIDALTIEEISHYRAVTQPAP